MSEIDGYERAADEIELAVMAQPIDSSDQISAVIEVMCRLLAEEECIPDQRFFSRLQTVVPGRVATIILEGKGYE